MGFSFFIVLGVVVLARHIVEKRFAFPLARQHGAEQGIGFGGLCALLLALTGPLPLWEMVLIAVLCVWGIGWQGARLATLYGDTRSLTVFPAALLGYLLAVTVSGAAFWGVIFGAPVAVGMALRGVYGVRWTRAVRQRAVVSAAVVMMVLLCGSFLHLF